MSRFDFTYGGGLNYRVGNESVVVDYIPHNDADQVYYNPVMKSRKLNDVGINMRIGMEYAMAKYLTIFSKVDLIGFVYVSDKSVIQDIQQQDQMSNNYPRRFDLSWRFGIGFNF